MRKTWKLWLTIWMLSTALGVGSFLGSKAQAGAIKTWSAEVLTHSDLNSNFAHIHNTMVGGHGARLVDADVSTSAAITHSKLASPILLPKAVAWTQTVCTTGTCASVTASGIASVAHTGTGQYIATFSSARSNTNFAVIITAHGVDDVGSWCHDIQSGHTTTTFEFECFTDDGSSGALTNMAWSIMILDDN